MFRRTLGWLATIALSIWAGYLLAYHPEVKHQLGHWQNLIVLLVAVVAALTIVWLYRTPPTNRKQVISAVVMFIVGIVVASFWGQGNVSLSALWIALAIVVAALLWVWTIVLKSSTRFAAYKDRYQAIREAARKPASDNDSTASAADSSSTTTSASAAAPPTAAAAATS
jgi:heme A synthase